MRLTLHTDYALRTLIYLAVADDEGGQIAQIAERYRISENHLRKVVLHLTRLGFVEATRGRGGGLRLARPASSIRVGEVVRRMEEAPAFVECFDPATNTCPILGACGLKGFIGEALEAFHNVLDGYTIADISRNERRLRQVLSLAKG
ncbi:MAG: Rrf2 family transcriptional regulator [Caulobacterales bacterium]